MSTVEFSIVRKLNKPVPKAAGLGLRSINGSPDSVTAVLYDLGGYTAVKENIAALRLRSAGGISYKTRGKSLELTVQSVELPNAGTDGASLFGRRSLQDVPAYGKAPELPRTDAVKMLFELLSECAFNTEDVLDVVEFVRTVLADGAEPALKALKLELSPDFFSIDLLADVASGGSGDSIYSAIDPLCTKYGMGIIKERQEELSEEE